MECCFGVMALRGMVFVTLLCFRLLRYVLTMVVCVFHVCFDLCIVYAAWFVLMSVV